MPQNAILCTLSKLGLPNRTWVGVWYEGHLFPRGG